MSDANFTTTTSSSGPLAATEAGAVHELSTLAGGVQYAGSDAVPFVVLPGPTGYAATAIEHLLPEPTRQRGTTTLSSFASFVAYLAEHADGSGDGLPVFWDVSSTGARFHAILNHDGWRDHRVHYQPEFSPRWKRWIAKNRTAQSQADFAQWIEDNAPDIIEPESATMIEVSRSIEAKKKVNFASGIRLANGQSELTYEETIEGTAGKGKFAIPEQFTIAIPVFVGGEPWKVNTRLRYRINDGKLALWYDLLRADDIVDAAVETMVRELEAQLACDVYRGSADTVTPIR